MYGQQFNSDVMKDMKALSDRMEKAESDEEYLKLRMARLYRGMELNSIPTGRNYRGYYPY